MNKKIFSVRNVVLLLILIVVISLLVIPSYMSHMVSNLNVNFSKDTNEIIKNIEENKSEINFNDFISIEMKSSELVYNKTTEKQTEDNELNNLMYNVSFKNKTKDVITFKFKMFIPNELAESIIVSTEPSIPSSEDLVLEPGKGTGIDSGRLMIHYNKLDKVKKELFEKYKDTLYFEFHMNGKRAYVKYSL